MKRKQKNKRKQEKEKEEQKIKRKRKRKNEITVEGKRKSAANFLHSISHHLFRMHQKCTIGD